MLTAVFAHRSVRPAAAFCTLLPSSTAHIHTFTLWAHVQVRETGWTREVAFKTTPNVTKVCGLLTRPPLLSHDRGPLSRQLAACVLAPYNMALHKLLTPLSSAQLEIKGLLESMYGMQVQGQRAGYGAE